jgi:hypothetical protein
MAVEDGQPERFTADWAQTWRNFVKPMLPSTILLVVLSFVLGYAVGGPVGCVALPVLLAAAMVGLARLASTRSAVRVSGHGIEVLSRGRVTGLRWADVDQVMILDKRRAAVVAPYGPALGAARASAQGLANANSGPGLVGTGTVLTQLDSDRVLRAGPDWLDQQGQQVPVRMFLTVVDRDWTAGPIGAWVRRYRPDLLARDSRG